MRFLEPALKLAALGWQVFPVSPGSKLPAISKEAGGQGVLDATTDAAVIRDWARRFPSANIGVACGSISRITVIDLDPKNGSDETIAALKAKKQIFTPTVLARTPSGGWHLYYRFESTLLNSKSKLGRGVDVRTAGGYVVAPPSVAGNPYRWVVAPLGGELPRMPRWALEKLKPEPLPTFDQKKIADPGAGFEGLIRFVENAKEGERNQSFFWACLRAAESGCVDEGSLGRLLAAADRVGLEKKESWKTLNSALKRARRLA